MLALIKLPPFFHGHTIKIVRKIPVIVFYLITGVLSGMATPAQPLSANGNPTVPVVNTSPKSFQIEQADELRSRIIDLISYSIGFYTEEMILWGKPIVVFRHNPEQQFQHLNDIVRHSLELYAHPAKDSFWGFSARLEKQLLNLHILSGYTIDYTNKTGGNDSKTISHRDLQKKVIELKNSATNEVEEFIDEHPEPIDQNGNLLDLDKEHVSGEDQLLRSLEKASRTDVALLIDSLFELDEVPHGLIDRINHRIQELENPEEIEFRKNQPLDPIAHLIETQMEIDNAELEIKLPKSKKPKDKPETTPIDFNSRVVELLEDNNRLMAKYNDRFDYMQSQINELREEQRGVSKETEMRLQLQIDELHSMIGKLAKDEYAERTAPGKSSAGLQAVEVIFERNSHDITLYHQTLLNEIAAGLIKNSAYKVMITGFADALGDKKYNILLSQQRAQSVRNYLAQRGIEESRLIVNYYGDNKSKTSNPLDRKVEIEWLMDAPKAN